MYYKIVAGEDIFDLNPGLKAVPGFKDMTDMQMKYVCFVCDPSFDNPVRTLIGRARREQSAELAGYKLDATQKRLEKNGREISSGHVASVENAIATFKKLHYDEKTDTYETLSNQIGEIQDFMKSRKVGDPKKLKQALELGVKLPSLVEAKQKIEQLLSVETNIKPILGSNDHKVSQIPVIEEEEVGDEPQSILDRYHNKRTIN
jgi:hypothetical protein